MKRFELSIFAALAAVVAAPALVTAEPAELSVESLLVPAPAAVAPAPAAGPVPIYKSQDWRIFDLGASCVAETVAVLDGVNHHLEVTVMKANAGPLEYTVRAESTAPTAVGLRLTTDRAKKVVYSFAKLSGAGTDTTFWNIPRGSDNLMAFLKREMKADVQAVDAVGAARAISFSLRGSNATLLELGKRCAGTVNIPLVAEMNFERAFLPQAVGTVDVTRLTAAQGDSLRGLFLQARSAFFSSAGLQADIEKLNSKYLREINELTALRRNLDRLTQKEIVRLQTAETNAKAAIAQANADLQALQPQVAATENDLTNANADYEAAYRAIQPHLPEYQRLLGSLRANESRQSQVDSDLRSTKARLADAKQELSSLNNESWSLRQDVSRARSEESNARSEYDRAAQESRRFDASSEVRHRIANDHRIRSVESEISQAEARISAQRSALSRQEAERNRLNGELLQCQQDPARDCSNERALLTDAQREFQEIRRGIEVLESNRDDKVRERSSIISQIENEVDSIDRDLRRREQEARDRYNDAERETTRIENRLRNVEQVEIPNRQNEIARLQSQQAQLESDLQVATHSVQSARTDLANFKAGVGFDALQAEVDRTLARVNGIKTQLTTLDREIKRRDKIIRDNQAALAQIAVDMQKTLDQIKVKEARSAEVQAALEPYEKAKADLAIRKSAADQEYVQAQSSFAALL